MDLFWLYLSTVPLCSALSCHPSLPVPLLSIQMYVLSLDSSACLGWVSSGIFIPLSLHAIIWNLENSSYTHEQCRCKQRNYKMGTIFNLQIFRANSYKLLCL